MVGVREPEPGRLEWPPRGSCAVLLSPLAHLPYAAQPQPRSLLGAAASALGIPEQEPWGETLRCSTSCPMVPQHLELLQGAAPEASSLPAGEGLLVGRCRRAECPGTLARPT